MATRKQRERMRKRRMEFDRIVEENRRINEETESVGKMTKAQLIQYAADNDIEIDKTAKKDEILTIIREAIR